MPGTQQFAALEQMYELGKEGCAEKQELACRL